MTAALRGARCPVTLGAVKICMLSPGSASPADAAAIARHAALLGERHEVAVVEPGPQIEDLVFAGAAHERSAAAMEAIRQHYGRSGPEYLEVWDSSTLGFVPLQARAGSDPVLAGAAVGVRVGPSDELRSLHNHTLSESANLLRAGLGRGQLRQADFLLWPGGDCLQLYRRYYGGLGVELPDPVRCRPAPAPVASASFADAAPADAPLRILCLGPLERARGTLDLVEACISLSSDSWELTLVGTDTTTATMGHSVAESVEAISGGDPRVRIRLPSAETSSPGWIAGFDLLAVPARTEGWSDAAMAAMGVGLPVLATPVGGLVEQVDDGATGWLADGIGPESLRRALLARLEDREGVSRVRGSEEIHARFSELSNPEPILSAYNRIEESVARARTSVRISESPLVTGVIPYYGAARFVAEALDSLLAQTYSPLEAIIVNDGSFAEADAILEELAGRDRVIVVTQANAGESSARNLGATLARGKYLLMLDADNAFEPTFAERAVAAFERDPELAYVTCWLRMVDEHGVGLTPAYGYAALGNGAAESDERNWDGDTLAMLPRRLFSELGYSYGPEGSMHSDWELYRWLRQEGLYGTVIPERLARYRILSDSLLRGHSQHLQDYGWNESRDRNRQRRVQWIADPS